MNKWILSGFLAGAIAATTGAYFAVRHTMFAPAPVLTVVTKAPAAPEIVTPTLASAPEPKPKAVARRKPEPPAFYLDPRPPISADAPEPERETPLLPVISTTASAPSIAPAVDLKVAPYEPHVATIPEGVTLDVRLTEPLSTQSHKRGDTFSATLERHLVADGFIVAEKGSRVEGRITEVEASGRVTGLARLSLELTKINTSDGQSIPIRTSHFVKSAPESKVDDGAKIALGAGIGAAIGAAAGQGKGAAIGAAAGAAAGAASVAIMRGKPAELRAEAHLTFTLQDPVTITEKVQ